MSRKLDPEIAVAKDAWYVYVWRANKKGLDCKLSFEQYFDFVKSPCAYCGGFTNNKSKRGRYRHNGVDRIDNTQGYILSNCVACCAICNKAKGSLTLAEFNEWLQRVVKYHNDTAKQNAKRKCWRNRG